MNDLFGRHPYLGFCVAMAPVFFLGVGFYFVALNWSNQPGGYEYCVARHAVCVQTSDGWVDVESLP